MVCDGNMAVTRSSRLKSVYNLALQQKLDGLVGRVTGLKGYSCWKHNATLITHGIIVHIFQQMLAINPPLRAIMDATTAKKKRPISSFIYGSHKALFI